MFSLNVIKLVQTNTYCYENMNRLLNLLICSANLRLTVAAHLRAALENLLLHQNSSLFTVTFGEEVLTLAKSRGS